MQMQRNWWSCISRWGFLILQNTSQGRWFLGILGGVDGLLPKMRSLKGWGEKKTHPFTRKKWIKTVERHWLRCWASCTLQILMKIFLRSCDSPLRCRFRTKTISLCQVVRGSMICWNHCVVFRAFGKCVDLFEYLLNLHRCFCVINIFSNNHFPTPEVFWSCYDREVTLV